MSIGPELQEPGCSLRAEIRRLRRSTLDTAAKIDALIEICGFDHEIFERLAKLGRSLQHHRELDHINGRHSHKHGDSLRHAAPALSDQQLQHMRWVKKQGDVARHAAFQQNVPLDVFELLAGMAVVGSPVCGAVLLVAVDEHLAIQGDSLLNIQVVKRAQVEDMIAYAKMACKDTSWQLKAGDVVYVDADPVPFQVIRRHQRTPLLMDDTLQTPATPAITEVTVADDVRAAPSTDLPDVPMVLADFAQVRKAVHEVMDKPLRLAGFRNARPESMDDAIVLELRDGALHLWACYGGFASKEQHVSVQLLVKQLLTEMLEGMGFVVGDITVYRSLRL